MAEFIAFFIQISIYLLVLLPVIYIARHFIWAFSPLFLALNHLIWFFANPVRWLWKSKESEAPRRIFTFLSVTLIAPLYFVIYTFLTTPLRLINAIYFDVFVYISIMLNDTLQDLFQPKRGTYRYEKGMKYFLHWVVAFPYRLIVFIYRSILTLLDSFLMVGISTALPTFTMYHGTSFEAAATKIAQDGKWRIGAGNFAGSGIYLGLEKRAGTHYANSSVNKYGGTKAVVVTRFTPTLSRNGATLPKELRQYIGSMGEDGRVLSREMRKKHSSYSTIEHWREDFTWWEYCLIRTEDLGSFINSWRIRPIALLKEDRKGKYEIHRLWGSMSHYSASFVNILVGALSWVALFYYLSFAINIGIL